MEHHDWRAGARFEGRVASGLGLNPQESKASRLPAAGRRRQEADAEMEVPPDPQLAAAKRVEAARDVGGDLVPGRRIGRQARVGIFVAGCLEACPAWLDNRIPGTC